MAAILTLFAGVLGLIVALISLALGGGFLTAFLLWTATGLAATTLGLIWSLIPHHSPARA
jgi:hypothetical protein